MKTAADTLTRAIAARYQQTDRRLAYTGSWTIVRNPAASGGSLAIANSAGSSVTIRFFGISATCIAKRGPIYGRARITVDGIDRGTVDLYSATGEWQQEIWATKTLEMGPHTITISWTGLKSEASSGAYINVEAFDVIGTLN
jgi:bacillopeptidase F